MPPADVPAPGEEALREAYLKAPSGDPAVEIARRVMARRRDPLMQLSEAEWMASYILAAAPAREPDTVPVHEVVPHKGPGDAPAMYRHAPDVWAAGWNDCLAELALHRARSAPAQEGGTPEPSEAASHAYGREVWVRGKFVGKALTGTDAIEITRAVCAALAAAEQRAERAEAALREERNAAYRASVEEAHATIMRYLRDDPRDEDFYRLHAGSVMLMAYDFARSYLRALAPTGDHREIVSRDAEAGESAANPSSVTTEEGREP